MMKDKEYCIFQAVVNQKKHAPLTDHRPIRILTSTRKQEEVSQKLMVGKAWNSEEDKRTIFYRPSKNLMFLRNRISWPSVEACLSPF